MSTSLEYYYQQKTFDTSPGAPNKGLSLDTAPLSHG